MAEMGLGYGSEYQLLRFLGHHREELNAEILKSLKIPDGIINWLEYPKDIHRLSLDSEYTGISFLENHDLYDKQWKEFWPQKGNPQNWDGIFKIGDKYYLVEAKAHINEISSDGHKHNEQISARLNEAKQYYGISYDTEDWEGSYYQQANRLCFIYFLKQFCNIDAELINIFFINGYDKRILKDNKLWKDENKNVASIEKWKSAIKKEYLSLGLNDKAKSVIHEVFINCGEEDTFSNKLIIPVVEQKSDYSISELRKMIIPRDLLLQKEKYSIFGKPVFSNLDPEIPGEVFRCHPLNKNLEASNYGRIRVHTKNDTKIVTQKETEKLGWLILDWPSDLDAELKKLIYSFKYDYVYRVVCDVWHGLNPGLTSKKYWERHHISNDGYDNRPENLIWVRPGDHRKIHSLDTNTETIDSMESNSPNHQHSSGLE